MARRPGRIDSDLTLLAGCGVPVGLDLALDPADRPDPAIERVVYFCLAELLTNVTKHSAANEAHVSVRVTNSRIRVEVADDGRAARSPTRAVDCEGCGAGWPRWTARWRSPAHPAAALA